MRHLFKNYLVMIGLTVLGMPTTVYLAANVAYFDIQQMNSFLIFSCLVAAGFMVLDFIIMRSFFQPIQLWLSHPEDEIVDSQVVQRAADRVLSFPYYAALYFLLAWTAGCGAVYIYMVVNKIYAFNSWEYVTLVVVMHACLLVPLQLYLSKYVLSPLREKLARAADRTEVRHNLVFGLRKKMVFAMMVMAMFGVLFGGIMSYSLVQPLLRQYMFQQAKTDLSLVNILAGQSAGGKSGNTLGVWLAQVKLHSDGFLFAVDKNTGAILN
ncbi:MAG: hypothetical protein HGA76_05225, partial [Candidatus Firestonebacteria bacterium]|nr:hypothetical protein [Candidatus Firestonebacteria bacterium]